MSVINHLISNLVLGCRIIYIICNFQFLLNTLIDQNRDNRQEETGFLLRSVFRFILSIIALCGAIAMTYFLLMFSCVMTDNCYYYYGGV
jgi:hypothetical protein